MAKYKRASAPSDSTMHKWWCKAVDVFWGTKCVWPGCEHEREERHHYVHKTFRLLRWSYKNGPPLCIHHHRNFADRTEGRWVLTQVLMDKGVYEYIEEMNAYTSQKEYYALSGMTRGEFLRAQLAELKRIVEFGR